MRAVSATSQQDDAAGEVASDAVVVAVGAGLSAETKSPVEIDAVADPIALEIGLASDTGGTQAQNPDADGASEEGQKPKPDGSEGSSHGGSGRLANVDDLFARLRAEREQAAAKAHVYLDAEGPSNGSMKRAKSSSKSVTAIAVPEVIDLGKIEREYEPLDAQFVNAGSIDNHYTADASDAGAALDVARLAPSGSEHLRSFDTDGLDTDGLDTDGLDTDGLDTDGLDTDGLDTDGLDTDGLDTDGLNMGGLDVDGVDVDGSFSAETLDESTAPPLRPTYSQAVTREETEQFVFVSGPLQLQCTRAIKRFLQDEQSSALAALRTARSKVGIEDLVGDEASHCHRMSSAIEVFVVDAYRAGVDGVNGTLDPEASVDTLRSWCDAFAATVALEIRGCIGEALSVGSDKHELSGSIADSYRSWTSERLAGFAAEYLQSAFSAGWETYS